MRKFVLFLLLIAVTVAYAAPAKKMPLIHPADQTTTGIATQLMLTPSEFDPPSPGQIGPYSDPLANVGRDLGYDVILGNAEVIGQTWYDYQNHGTLGKMIAVDPTGTAHIMWMKGYDAAWATRHQNYNYRKPNGEWGAEYNNTIIIEPGVNGGYGHVTLLPTDIEGWEGWKAVGIFHSKTDANAVAASTFAVDLFPSLGAFEGMNYLTQWDIVQGLLWPKGAISKNLKSHIVGYELPIDGDQLWCRLAYWHGTPADNDYLAWNFSPVAVEVGTISAKAAVVSASRLSNKVVIAWHENRPGRNTEPWANGLGVWQRNNDIRYIVLEDGEEFDPETHQSKSLTRILPPNPDMWDVEPVSVRDPMDPDDIDEPYGDIWRPYDDIDIQFDPWEDNMYCAFGAGAIWERPFADDAGNLFDGLTGEHNLIWFWNSELDTFTLAANGWYFNRTNNSANGQFKSRCGAWRANCDRPSIAFDPETPGRIFLTYVNYPKIMQVNEAGDNFEYIEGATDTSRAGYSNAEVMLTISSDYGITWSEPLNLTGTRWVEADAPEPGQCMSEAWQSVDVLANGSLNLMYIADTDAGGKAQREGEATNSPVVYHNVPLEDINFGALQPLALPFDGFIFHNYPQPRPEIVGEPVRAPAVPSPFDQVTISATFYSGGEGLIIDEATLTFFVVEQVVDSLVSLQAEQVPVAMVQTGVNGQNYTFAGEIPEALIGKSVWYTVKAKNSGGLSVVYPRGNDYMSYTVRPEGELKIQDVQYRFKGWSNDYSPYRGYEVTVHGIVTTPATYNEMFGAYAIQDGSGIFSGLLVRGVAEDLAEGDLVSVTGTVFEKDPNDSIKWAYATYIDVRTYTVISTGNPAPDPVVLKSPSLLFPTSEYYEGMLVHLWDLTVADTLGKSEDVNYGYWPIIDNEIEVGKMGWAHCLGMVLADKDSVEWDVWTTGTVIEHITGILTENYGNYAVGPRQPGDIGVISVDDKVETIPTEFKLTSVYPNPFNGVTRVNFALPNNSNVRVSVYDLSGRMVLNVSERKMSAGYHSLNINAGSLATGVYILRVETPATALHQKMVLVK